MRRRTRLLDRRVSLAAPALLTLLAVATLAWRGPAALRFETLPADDPTALVESEVAAQFGMTNPVVWVVAARRGTIWNPETLGQVRDLTRSVLRIPGVVATEVMSLASPNVRDLAVSDDALGAEYLLATIPRSPEQLAALRRRVEANPNFRGSLVSLDGAAAMIVADFRGDADDQGIAAEALRLRDTHRDDHTDVWVVGAPLLASRARAEWSGFAAAVAAIVAAGCAALAMLAGGRVLGATVLTAVLAVVWTAALLVLADGFVVPWTLHALLPVLGIAAALALEPSRRSQRRVALALACGFAAVAIAAVAPAYSVAVAGVLGTGAAIVAARLVAVAPPQPRFEFHAWWRDPALLVLLFCLIGLASLRSSFAAFGHGARYLPTVAAEDLRGLGRYFPPPTALVVRARGEAGFLRSPEVLRFFERLTETARRDRAVVRAMSAADLVKLVNQSFNDGMPEYYAIPDDASVVGRYLSMSYSPAFRRFVDRAFTNAAVWVYVHGDDPADLMRVRDALAREIEAAAPAGVEITFAAGDGAVALRTAELARSLAFGWLLFAVAAGVALAAVSGGAAAIRAGAGCCAAAAASCGMLGWLGVPIDLVSLAAIGAAAVFGWTFTALGGRPALVLAMAASAAAAMVASYLSGSLLGYAIAPALAAPLLVGALLPSDLAAAVQRQGGTA